jgi:hypothetical protein
MQRKPSAHFFGASFQKAAQDELPIQVVGEFIKAPLEAEVLILEAMG